MTSPVLPVSRIRDLTLLDIGQGRVIVVACDSSGAIGPKPHDTFPSSAAWVAHCATRVAMLEILSCGAQPELIVDTLSVEMEPTGSEIIAEVRRMAAWAGLGPDRVTGSTEDNVPSVTTGIGVTIVASARRDALRPGTSQPGDRVICLGEPASAPADTLVPGDPRMVPIETMVRVLGVDGVHDALPVGSRGVGHESAELASTAGMRLERSSEELDLAKSGGPSTCVLVSVADDSFEDVLSLLPADLPRTMLGRLTR